MQKLVLSIAVVTMNRARQLKEALNSCLACKLPDKTEFVIIDNNSTDNTKEIVEEVLKNSGYEYYYEKLNENLGVGKGRNYAFEKSNGLYFYSLDDDAVISDRNKDFFIEAIRVFEENENVATLTTQIYDELLKKNRVESYGKELTENLTTCFSFCGGSHFLRKDFFKYSPYFANEYGCEELLPSFKAYNEGKFNVFYENLLVYHKPLVDKWNFSKNENKSLLIKCAVLPYAIKKMMYPKIFLPILYLGFKSRCKKHGIKGKEYKSSIKKVLKTTLKNYKISYKIKTKSVIKMYKEFGLTVL